MLDRLTALKELTEKIEAGKIGYSSGEFKALGFPCMSRGLASYNGSLDAAHSLHKAVLPNWAWAEMRLSTRPKVTLGFDEIEAEGQDKSLARAWLLAIIKAKIQELEE